MNASAEIFFGMLKDSNLACHKRVSLLTLPLPKNIGTMKLTIVRKATGFTNLNPKYYLFNENGDFLINAKKSILNYTNTYLLSNQKDVFNKDSYSYIGKFKGRLNKILRTPKDPETGVKDDLAVLMIKPVDPTKGSSYNIDVALPGIGPEGVPYVFDSVNDKQSLLVNIQLIVNYHLDKITRKRQ